MAKRYNASTNKKVRLGRSGENLAREIAFDIADWIEEYGEGTVHLLHMRSEDSTPYPVVTTREENTVIWAVANSDTAYVGEGKCELQYLIDDVLVKSATYITFVSPSLGDKTMEYPPPATDWVQEVLGAANEVSKAVEDVGKAVEDVGNATEEMSQAIEEVQKVVEEIKEAQSESVGKIVNKDWYGGNPENQVVYSEIFNDYTNNKAVGRCNHVEGVNNEALSDYGHVEGSTNIVGYCAHAEGSTNEATGTHGHAEGYKTKAFGEHSHSQNLLTEAHGNSSSASGYGTVAREVGQSVCGTWNKDDPNALFIVGNGERKGQRSNAFAVHKDGTAVSEAVRTKTASVDTLTGDKVTANTANVDTLNVGGRSINDDLIADRYSRPFAIDFKAFATQAKKQSWWEDLDDPINTLLVGKIKTVGVVKHGVSATPKDTVLQMDTWMKDNLNWYITNLCATDGTGYFGKYCSHTLAIDPAGEYYGVRFRYLDENNSEPPKSAFNITFFAPEAGRYRMTVESFFEYFFTEYNKLVPDPWYNRSGGYVTVSVNGEQIKARVPFGNTDSTAAQKDTLVDIGLVDLVRGENTLSFNLLDDFDPDAQINFSINFSNISFIPQWMDFRLNN